jgi:nucleoside-diphosphate-sugar epimerase
MRILLTGAGGFIGTAFLREALRCGHEVAGLYLPGHRVPEKTVGLVTLTGSLANAPWPEISQFEPETCVHTAWITTPGDYLESPKNETFLKWSQSFLDRLAEMGAPHIVGLGTCIEYELSDQPLREDRTPLKPQSLYAQTKNDLRLYGERLANRDSFSFAWARVFYPFGPGEHPSRLCSSLIRQLTDGRTVVLKTPQSRKDYIYIDDVATALLRVVESRFDGCINIGTGSGITVARTAEIIAKSMGREDLLRTADPPAVDPFPCVVADATRLKGLGWLPRISAATGLRRMIDEFKD